jgi:ribonuclease BN (tRNA processing enzyme)
VTRLAKGADVGVTEASIPDRFRIAKIIRAMATKRNWPLEMTRMMVEHFTLLHLDEQEIGEMATKARAKAVILHHFNPKDPAAYVAGVKKHYSGPVFAGADLQRCCLGTGTEAASRELHRCN